MGKENSNTNKTLVVIIVLLLAIIIGGGAYFLFFQKNGDEKAIPDPAVADVTDDEKATVTTKDTLLGKLDCVKDQIPGADYCKIDSSKILNARAGATYTLTELTKTESQSSDFEKLAKITIDKDDAKKIKITFDKDVVEQFYGTKNYGYTIDISFDRDVESARIAGFGQGVGDEYIFFLMKDGTLDMLRVSAMLKDKNFNPHRIKGIDHIVAVLGGSSYKDNMGGHTNYAVRSDQTAYDLETLLPSWGVQQ